MIGIYMITSPNGKVYIGKSINVKKRFRYYRSLNTSCKQQTKLYNSLVKYGPDNHGFYVIHECTECQLNDMERFYIKLYDTFNSEHGMNLRSGGEKSSIISNETRGKLSKSAKNRKYTKEGLMRMSLCQKGKKASEVTRLRMSLSARGKHFINKSCLNVHQLLGNDIIQTWNSISEASRNLGIQKSNISRSLDTKYKAGGFLWKTVL